MNKLIAIPFDRYESKYTTEGIIYNIVDCSNNHVIVQIHVTHIKYTLNDLGIQQISGAPENCLNHLRKVLNNTYGKDQWKIVTCLNYKHHYIKIKEIIHSGIFTPQTRRLLYDPKNHKVDYLTPYENPQNPF